MPKRDEEALKRTYRFPKSLLARLEAEAAKYRRPVNTQLEIALEEWFAQQDKKAEKPGQRVPARLGSVPA